MLTDKSVTDIINTSQIYYVKKKSLILYKLYNGPKARPLILYIQAAIAKT